MPNRILREGILSSERVAALIWDEEVFYRRLMSVVDDFGRYSANPKLLRAACYPLFLEKVSDSDIGKWLLATEKAGLVRVYLAADEAADRKGSRRGDEPAGGSGSQTKRYLELLDFGQQIRAKASKYPSPDEHPPSKRAADAQHLHSSGAASAHLGVSVSVSGDVVEDGDGVEPARKRATRPPKAVKTAIPEPFAVSERVATWAAEHGFSRLSEHLEAFVRKCKARSYSYADWDAAFMEAIREDWAKLRGRMANGAAPPPERGSTAGDPMLWRKTFDGVMARGTELGLSVRPGEMAPDFERRVLTAHQRTQGATT